VRSVSAARRHDAVHHVDGGGEADSHIGAGGEIAVFLLSPAAELSGGPPDFPGLMAASGLDLAGDLHTA
jgi:hypothetical protein